MTLSINIPAEWGAILGRLSVKEDRSKGDIIRRAMERGLEESHPAEAAQLVSARERHRATKAGICLSAAMRVIGLQFTQHQTDPMRRAGFRNRVSIRREVVA